MAAGGRDEAAGVLILIQGAHIHAPADQGAGDLLLGHGKILAVAPRIDVSALGALGSVTVVRASGLRAIPGLIDLHLHFLGGAGAFGPSSRTQELSAADILGCGVTSAVGLLGVDLVTRSPASLYGKALGLEASGLTTWMYAGGFVVPSPTVTGGVRSDLLLIDKVVGVKVAVAEPLASSPTVEELARLAHDVYAGGRLRGRGGILHVHMGLAADPYPLLGAVLERSGVPPRTLLLCHTNYSASLLDGARRFAARGTYLAVDSTLDPALEREGSVAPATAVLALLEAGIAPARLILQSDANGHRTAGLRSLPAALHALVTDARLPVERALALVTTNPAAALGMTGIKGVLAPGADADVALVADDFTPRYVFTAGQQRLP